METTNSEDKVSSKSGRVAVEGSSAMVTMVQSVSKCEGIVEMPLKILKPAERTKFQRKEKSRRLRDLCKVEAVNQPHVLAVDDNSTDRRIVEKCLKAFSYRVTTVDSALRALEYLGLSETCSTSLEPPNRTAVDLIITDYYMPDMTGYELLKIVKSDSLCKEIPVIVMSSEGGSNRINRCLAEGAGAYIIKPVKMEDVKRLRGHIRSSALSSESSESSKSSIGAKRKSPDGVQLHNPERRPRTAESLVS